MEFRIYLLLLHLVACIVHGGSAILVSMYQLKYENGAGTLEQVDGLPLKFKDYSIKYANETATISAADGDAFFWSTDGFTAISLLFANELITSIMHAIAAVMWVISANVNDEPYTVGRCLDNFSKYRRWIEYIFTAALIESAIFLSQGVTDPFIHIFIFALNFALQTLGLLTEIDLLKVPNDSTSGNLITRCFRNCSTSSAINVVLGFLVLIPPVWYAFYNNGAKEEGEGKVDPFLLVLFTAFYASFGVYQTLRYFINFNVVPNNDEESCLRQCPARWNPEATFTILSITTKLLLTWFLVVEIHIEYIQSSGIDRLAGKDGSLEWLESWGRIWAIGLPSALFLLLSTVNSFCGKYQYESGKDAARGAYYMEQQQNFPMLKQIVKHPELDATVKQRVRTMLNRSGRYEQIGEGAMEKEEGFVPLSF